MPFHCHGIYTPKCAGNQIWKCCHLSHSYGLYLLIPGTILQLWILSQKYEETLYLLPLRIAVRVTCWARWSCNVLVWPCPRLSISGSGDWLLGWCGAGGEGKKEKLSHKLEAKYPYISWISHFLQHPGEYKLNKAVDRNIFLSDTHSWTCWTLIRREKSNKNRFKLFLVVIGYIVRPSIYGAFVVYYALCPSALHAFSYLILTTTWR